MLQDSCNVLTDGTFFACFLHMFMLITIRSWLFSAASSRMSSSCCQFYSRWQCASCAQVGPQSSQRGCTAAGKGMGISSVMCNGSASKRKSLCITSTTRPPCSALSIAKACQARGGRRQLFGDRQVHPISTLLLQLDGLGVVHCGSVCRCAQRKEKRRKGLTALRSASPSPDPPPLV